MCTWPSIRRCAVVALLLPLVACGGGKQGAYIEKPVDELYNRAMDQVTEERYGEAAKTFDEVEREHPYSCLLYTSPSPRDLSTSRMPSSA